MRNNSVTYNLYADVILVNNFTMDFLLLTAVRRMMKLEARRYGLVTASLAGAVYALAVMIVPLPVFFLQTLLTCVGMSTLMVVLAFRLRSRAQLFRSVTGLYLAAVTAAGVMELLRPFGWFSVFWLYGVAAVGSVWLTSSLWSSVSSYTVRSRHLYQVELQFGEKKQTVTAFLDTGNHLTEPVSGKPVSILWGGAAEELLAESEGVFCIPFHSVGRENGILPAVRADRMEIQMDGWRQIVERPYIAISEHPLSQNGSYQMLLNEKMWL